MTFVQLRYFLSIVQTGSFSLAAEQTYVSQSSLSKQIKALENELGARVFERNASGVSLTPAGAVFLEFAQKTLVEHENALAQITQHTFAARSRVKIGALPLLSEYGFFAKLADFQTEYADIQVDLHEREQRNLERRLRLGQIELAIMRTDFLDPREFEWVPLVIDEMVVISGKGHPLAEKQSVSLSQLKNERFVMLDENSGINQVFNRACRSAGFTPHITSHHSRHEPLLAAVMRNLGLTILPSALLREDYMKDLDCTWLKEILLTELGIVCLRGHRLSAAARKIHSFFVQARPHASALNVSLRRQANGQPTPA